MKKLRNILLAFLTAICLCLTSLTACGSKALTTPTSITCDDNYNISWLQIENARSYILEVTPVSADGTYGESKQYTTRKAQYSLSGVEEGDYDIRVKAVSGNKSYSDSEWSEAVAFEKGYESGCIYTLINGSSEYEVTKYGTASGDVNLGDMYRNKPITSIAASAFKGSSKVQNVTVGKYVKTINENAFYNCRYLVSVTLPESLTTLGTAVFQGCSALESVNIPGGITEIDEYTFAYCRALKSIDLSGVQSIADNAFKSCSALEELVIGDDTTSIGDNTFAECSALKSVSFGSGLETVGEYAFYGCSALESVEFAEESSLVSLDEYAFSSCSALTSISLPEGLTELGNGCFYRDSALETVEIPDTVSHIGQLVFNGTAIYTAAEDGQYVYVDNWLVGWKAESETNSTAKSETTRIVAADFKTGTIGIADAVFAKLKSLKTVRLSDSIKYVGKYAFAYDTAMTTFISFQDELTGASDLLLVDSYAFLGCEKLENCQLSDGLKKIGNYAFYNCAALCNNSNNILVPKTVETIGRGAFKNSGLYNEPDDSTGIVYVNGSGGYCWIVAYTGTKTELTLKGLELSDGTSYTLRGIGDYAFADNETLKTVTISGSATSRLKYIGEGAFKGCVKLENINLELPSLTTLGNYTFYGCSSLKAISLHDNLTSIGRSAFYQCASLTSVDMHSTAVESVGMYAFFGCTALKTVKFGSDVETIGDYAFYKCSSLESVDIPDSVTYLGRYAFYKCQSLTSATLGEGITQINKSTFSGCVLLESVVIPETTKTIGDYAFYNCQSLSSLTLSEGVVSVGDYAFAKNYSVTSLVLPQTLESIGRYAFMQCKSLTCVYLSKNIKTMGVHAFYGCYNTTDNAVTSGATFYTDAEALSDEETGEQVLPEGWSSRWNSSYRPAVFGCTLKDGYVYSIAVKDEAFVNCSENSVMSAPERDGYTFLGWAYSEGATEADLSLKEAFSAEADVLYSVWQVKQSEDQG